MEYIKKNKIFTFLIVVLIISIFFLIVQFFNRNTSSVILNNRENEPTSVSIDEFSVSINPSLDVVFHWQLIHGDEKVEKVEIYHNDVLFQDVSDKAMYSTALFATGLHTGNNEFTLKVSLDTGEVLEKSTYEYIDEVLGFQISNTREGNILRYTVAYYYDQDAPVSAPQVSIDYREKVNMLLRFVSNTQVSQENDYILMNAIYEIDLSNVAAGSYQVAFTFSFDEYNLEFNNSEQIDK